MTPKISVITSTYNRPDRLLKAVASVQNQTLSDWELLVVEDGATPELAAVMGSLTAVDNRISYLALPERSGSDPAPKNLGIRQAHADLIAFLDDDNAFRPDHLDTLFRAMQADPTLDIAYGDRWVIDESGRHPPQQGTYAEQFSAGLLMQQNYIDTSDALVRASALRYVGGFDERYRKYVDWNLWIRLAKAGFRFRRVPRILTDYALHGESKSVRPEDELAPQRPAWNPFDLDIRLPYLGPVAPPRVAIFTVAENCRQAAQASFPTLYRTAGYPFDHVVIDNGSHDGTWEWLTTLASTVAPSGTILLHRNDVAEDPAAAADRALSLVGDDYDIIGGVACGLRFLSDGWMRALVEVWLRNHLLAASPRLHDPERGTTGPPGTTGLVNGEPIQITQRVKSGCAFADRRAWQAFRHTTSPMANDAFSEHVVRHGFVPAVLMNHTVVRIDTPR